ncbi:MAG: hypothetical protein M1819_005077 [Sarea resinae]|nr:MAG: hypothetical protein M1819_005077 [Sarea resinae]
MSSPLPANVHVSQHPCLLAKLSQLRSSTATARETKGLVHEISLILGCEALSKGVKAGNTGEKAQTPLGNSYETTSLSPENIALVPILRSGLGMVDAFHLLLPHPTPVHHLGLFREPTTLQPVEYYNNLPYHSSSSTIPTRTIPPLAILLDPVIATGGTSSAAIQTLREWGVQRVLVVSILASAEGVRRAAGEWPDGVDVWVAAVDDTVDAKGMIRPGIGDVGDRLFLTVGK